MSYSHNPGLGLSVKQNQLRHSQHFQQQMLQSQQNMSSSGSPGMVHLNHLTMAVKQNGSASGSGGPKALMQNATIKMQSNNQSSLVHKPYQVHQKFAKSECPTPKSHEIESRLLAAHQQKFFTRKSSGIAPS